jgi:HD-like signal output (HDOD) protein
MTNQNNKTIADGDGSVVDFLLRRMQRRKDFPVLSETIRTLNRLTSSNEKSVEHLAAVIVRDYALTNKILKVVNSAYYGGFAGKVGTISRAIVVLGIEPVRSLAASLILFEQLANHRNAARVKALIGQSVFAALLARQFTHDAGLPQGEEAFLAAMFHNLGELLVAYYLPEEDAAIQQARAGSGMSQHEAEFSVLGVDLEHLGIAIGRHWSFPSAITHAMKTLPPGELEKPKTDDERLRQMAILASQMTGSLAAGEAFDSQAVDAIMSRFAENCRVDRVDLGESLRVTRSEYRVLAASLAQQDTAPAEVRALAGTMRNGADATAAESDELEDMALPQEEPADDALDANPEPVLLEGLQEVTAMLAGNDAMHELAQVVLETLYRALGLRRVCLALRDASRRQFVARMGFGDDIDAYIRAFRFDERYERDVFHVALKKKTDVHIANLSVGAEGHGIPPWYHRLSPDGALLFLPLVVQDHPVGFLLAEHTRRNGLGLPPPVLRLVRALRNQLALGLQLRRRA